MIPQQEIVDKISHIALPIVQELLLDLVDVELVPSGRRWLLRIYIDKEGGVSIADCEKVSRELDRLLDVEDFIDHPYALEVSSPGLTRPLKKARDFERSTGRTVRIITRSPIDGKNELRGEIIGVAGDDVAVKTGGDVVHTISLDEIKKANLEFEL
jgi:ribosome maturation factor RimP